MTATGALVARLRRCANRVFSTTDGVFTAMTPLLPPAGRKCRRLRLIMTVVSELIPSGRTDLGKPTFGTIASLSPTLLGSPKAGPLSCCHATRWTGVSLIEIFQWTGEKSVSIKDAERQLESSDLARTKWLMGTGLASCNPQKWNEWLADDVVLSLRLGAVDTTRIDNLRDYSGVFRAVGKKQSRHVLKGISSGLKP